MDKYKLFKLKSYSNFDILKISLLNNKSISNTAIEVYPISLTDSELSFTFSENRLVKGSFLNKNKEEQSFEYLEIDSFNFKVILKDNEFFLLLINPPRSLKNFKQTFSEQTNYKVSIDNISIDPIYWIEHLEQKNNILFKLVSIEIRDIILDTRTNSSMTLKSQIDLREINYLEKIPSKYYKICKALVINDNYFKGKCILSKDASFQLECFNSATLIEYLISALK